MPSSASAPWQDTAAETNSIQLIALKRFSNLATEA
jgi:hypothetical protein